MTTVGLVRSSGAGFVTAPRPVRVAAECNDPVQKVGVRGGQVRISGTATNRGFAPSVLSLSIDGKKISMPLNGGQTPMATFEALKKKLPAGYEATHVITQSRPGGDVMFQLVNKQTKPPSISKIPTNIVANGANAAIDAKLWVNLMPVRPPGGRPVIGKIDVKGVGFADAPPKFKVASISVYEQGTNKLVGTFKSPKMQESETRWGEKTQSYRIELPNTIDMKKKYTVVVNTGINGSKPDLVRSAYLPISKVY